MALEILHLKLILLLMIIGGIGGFLSGLLGVGGGIVFVPALFFCLMALDFDGAHVMHVAVGTSLAVVCVTIGVSAFHHFKRKAVDIDIVRNWGPYIICGVLIGSIFASSVEGHTLRQIFAVLMGLMAVYMFFGGDTPEKERHHKIPDTVLHGISIGVGLLSSMIGIGGAMLNIPLMTYTGVPIQRAVGTGAALGFVAAFPGMFAYSMLGIRHMSELPPFSWGYINLAGMAVIIPMSILVAPQGVKMAHRLPQRRLRRIFSVVLALVSLRMFMAM